MTERLARCETFTTRPYSRFVWAAGLNPKLCAVFLPDGFTGGGDLFDCYPDQDPVVRPLAHGTGFSSGWVLDSGYIGPQGGDKFESYSVGPATDLRQRNPAFSGNWVTDENYTGFGPVGTSGSDTYESYTDGATVNGLSDGAGWSGPWITNQPEGADPAKLAVGSDTFESYSAGPTTTTGHFGHLNYTGFANWDVVQGDVDLVGNGFWDFYPGNGLFVDMGGTPFLNNNFDPAVIQTKTAFALAPGDTYRLTLKLGGNLRVPGTDAIKVELGALISLNVSLGWTAPLADHTFDFTPSSGSSEKVKISYVSSPMNCVGTILAEVTLTDLTTSTVIFHEDFDSEGLVTQSLPYGGYGWAGCWVVAANIT